MRVCENCMSLQGNKEIFIQHYILSKRMDHTGFVTALVKHELSMKMYYHAISKSTSCSHFWRNYA